jgi:prepilin-type N-terminal cleavage/methylation domain-containing protein
MTTPALSRFAESRQSAPLAGWPPEKLAVSAPPSSGCQLRAADDEVGWFSQENRSARRATRAQDEGGLQAPGGEVEARKLRTHTGRLRGFTLVEVMVALGIVTLLFSGILTAYIQSSRQAEWTGYSLAAQAIGVQQIEQARSGVWDLSISKNELTNLNLLSWTYNAATKVGTGYTTNVLDLPISGTNNVVMATNFVTVKMLNLTGLSNVLVQMVTVDTVWPLTTRYGTRLFTNRTATYYGPDNRDVSSIF